MPFVLLSVQGERIASGPTPEFHHVEPGERVEYFASGSPWDDVDAFAARTYEQLRDRRRSAALDASQHWVTFAKWGSAYRWRAQLRPSGRVDMVRVERQHAAGAKWHGPRVPAVSLVSALQVALDAWRQAGGPKGKPTQLKEYPR